ncbi:MAG TPA: Hpt domain-containing protein [Salinimicrobium sp.]|nr:Hpt domain-containing protein [Salinimicrobium sp.]
MSTYNLDSVREMAGGDEEFLKVIVQTFLEEVPADVEQMRQSIAQENAKLTYQFAHKMKPNLQMFGLDLLKEIKSVEAWANGNKSKKDVVPAIDKIVNTVTAAAEELRRDFEL